MRSGRASSQAAQQRLQSSVSALDGAAPRCRSGRFQGALPWPVRGAISSRFGRQPSSRFGTAIVRNGIEIGVRRGTAGEGGPRRRGRVCRPVHRLRQPGHRRARRPRVLAVRPSRARCRWHRASRLTRKRCSAVPGRNPNGTPALVLRAARRRQAGRSLTMATERDSNDLQDPHVRAGCCRRPCSPSSSSAA